MRKVLRRLLGASASPVAAGGESGWGQGLVPSLVVLVVAFAALNVHAATGRSHRAATVAGRASAFLSAVQDARTARGATAQRAAMFIALGALDRAAPSDRHADAWHTAANAAAGDGTPDQWSRLSDLATGARDDFAAEAAHADEQARRRLSMTLGGGGALALLLMWTFWAKRTRVALARNERRFRSLV